MLNNNDDENGNAAGIDGDEVSFDADDRFIWSILYVRC